MKKNNSRVLGTLTVLGLWLVLVLMLWFGPRNSISESERRPLAQAPEISGEAVLSGSFMNDFEEFTLDQFPFRDGFRRVKSLFHFYALRQKDNNQIYIEDGFAAVQEYPLNTESVHHALDRFQGIYDRYLKEQGSAVTMAIVPDKGYYLGAQAGQLRMDYETMFALFREGMPWANHLDLTASLSAQDYYRTDTHWRQERLLEAAGVICEGLGVTAPRAEDFRATALERPFYGVYYGQAALPMEPDTMYLMESALLENCTVYDHESGETAAVYNLDLLDSRDLYDVYLSGSRSLLTIHNPAGISGKELIVFRDSFGSSMVPLILGEYETVTVVDIRYLSSAFLDRFVDFHGQDVLFLYSTLVLNNSNTIK